MLSLLQLGKDFGELTLECCVLSGQVQKLEHGHPPQDHGDGSLAHEVRSVSAEWLWGHHAVHLLRVPLSQNLTDVLFPPTSVEPIEYIPAPELVGRFISLPPGIALPGMLPSTERENSRAQR
jgi:hypothetical protein